MAPFLGQAYCLKCNKVKDDGELSRKFKTGFRFVQGIKFYLGICKDHAEESS